MRSKKTLVTKKTNNRGMSLVEVIIAITILGIVAVPVLHSLTTSMVYNQKARTRQKMTLTAESIMETFKGYDLDTLITRFGGTAAIEGVEYETVDTDSGYDYSATSITLGTENTSQHVFRINDMKANNGQLFDVTITATPNSVEKIMEPENMEPTRDAIFKGDREYDAKAQGNAVTNFISKYADDDSNDLVSAFSAAADAEGYHGAYMEIGGEKKEITDDLVDKLNLGSHIQVDEKRLIFEIDKDGSDYVVTASLEYGYHFTKYPYYVKKEITTSSKKDEYVEEGGSEVPSDHKEEWESKELDFYSTPNSLTLNVALSDAEANIYKNPVEAKLSRLFVYYYPNYGFSDEKDKILIRNRTDLALQCYLLKQRTNQLSETATKTKENGYKAYVNVENKSGGSCEIFHNFDDNIGGGSSTTEPSITGENIVEKYSYTTKSSGMNPGIVTKFEETEVLSYRLVLEITQGEGANKREITKIESTMNEKIKPTVR